MRYFVAVAEEGNIGRAAQRLGIAQPPLSRALQLMERRLGADLLVRTPRGVELTTPGEVFLRESRAALDAVDAAERRTRRAVERPGAVVLAVKAGVATELLGRLLDAHAATAGASPVDLLLTEFGDSEPALRDGRADVALLHLPLDGAAGLDHVVVGSEDLVALLPARHPLTAREAVTLAEVAALPDLPPPRWRSPDGTVPHGPGPLVRDQVQLAQLVALGRTAAIVPRSCARSAPTLVDGVGRGVGVVTVMDAAPLTVVLAWPGHGTAAGVRRLVDTAVTVSGVDA